MRIIAMQTNEAMVVLNERELVMINNALNEVRGMFDSDEMQIRMGVQPSEVGALLEAINQLLDSLENKS
jgi:hypothetical protein